LTILGLAMATMFFGNIFGFVLVAQKQQHFLLKLYSALALFNIIANLIFIPQFGAIAAAWTTVITELLATVFAARAVFMAHRFMVPASYILQVIAIAALVGLSSIWLSSLLHVIQLLLYAALYGFGIYLTGLLSKRHLTLVWSRHA